jgi:hypothetical protein
VIRVGGKQTTAAILDLPPPLIRRSEKKDGGLRVHIGGLELESPKCRGPGEHLDPLGVRSGSIFEETSIAPGECAPRRCVVGLKASSLTKGGYRLFGLFEVGLTTKTDPALEQSLRLWINARSAAIPPGAASNCCRDKSRASDRQGPP